MSREKGEAMAVTVPQRKMYFSSFLRKHNPACWCEQAGTEKWKNNEIVVSIACISKGLTVQAAGDKKAVEKNTKRHTAYPVMLGGNL